MSGVPRSQLLNSVCDLLEDVIVAFAGTPQEASLRNVLARTDEPLRVAIAGKVKAGKSTLLNALVGEQLAPTDQGECTRIVTWYRNSHTYRVMVEPHGAAPRQAPFHRDGGALDVDLGGLDPLNIDRMVVEWPSRSLERITLIDTPGIDSTTTAVSDRAHRFLTPDDDRVTEADAVLYLMKHLHANDVSFLESFHDEAVSQATPVNAIAVLSRADEVGAGKLDSMDSAHRIADRYRADAQVRRLAQTVVPIAGLLGETASTLREGEFRALSELAGSPGDELDGLLLSVDRFVNARTATSLTSLDREVLLSRLGLFGVRVSLGLISSGQVTTSAQLAQRLLEYSGLPALREVLLSQFADRRDVLKARTGLLAIEAALKAHPGVDSGELARRLERIEASGHEFNELRLLNAIRTGAVTFKAADLDDVERLLGTSGSDAASRLGIDRSSDPVQARASAAAALAKWQRKAENPITSSEVAAACRVLVRTCEGLITSLS